MPTIRPMTLGDLLALDQIDPSFETTTHLAVRREENDAGLSFRLVEEPLPAPFVKEEGYRYDRDELAQARYRLEESDAALQLVAEEGGRLVAILEVEGEAWRGTALIWALFVDRSARGQGLGGALLARAEAWARAGGYRALTLETQSNNPAAIRFYARHGFTISGLDSHFYRNDDLARREVALFMYKELEE